LSRVTRVTHSDSSYSQVAYGNGAQLCSASTYGYGYPVLNTDESSNQRRSFTDALGRVIEVDEPDPSNGNSLTLSTCYTYDAQGSLTGVVQGSETRSYSYDGLSRMTQSTTPEGGTTHYYFTTSGGALCANNQKLVCRKTDARGITTTYIYDALDRLTGKSYSNGDASIAYYYDQTSYNGLTITNGLGQRTGMHDASGQTAWSYDKMGRTIAEERTIGTVTKTMSYGYELDGSLASITYPGGRIVSYTYGSDSRPISAVDSANSINYVTGATYAPPGGLAGMVEGEVSGGFAGITTSNGFNSRLFPTLLSASSSNGTALSLSYSYFANGNVNVETNGRDNGRSVTYTYDALNRVSTAASQATSGSDCWGQSFGYDRYANLTTINVTQCTAPMLSLSVNTNNQITNASFNYDAAGDLTGDGIYTYSWNAERHLTSAANVTYAYDGNLQRVKKSSGTLYWHSPAGVPLAETDPSGNTLNEYVYFGSARVARRDSSGNVYYYFEDHLGTATTLSNASGVLCYDADFLPFGSELTHIASCAQNYKFTGLERDAETGLDHTKFRKYDSSFGRWLTPDPKAGSPANPQSWNRYAYARDNPTNNVDPLGLYPCPSNCTFYEDEGPGYCVCDPEPGGFGGSGGGPCENIVMAGSFVRPNVMGCEPRGGNGGPRRLVDSATNKWAHNLLKSVWGEFSTGNCLGKIAAVFNAVFKSQGLSYSTSDFLAKANSTCFYDANNPTFGNLTENYVTSGQVLGDAGSTTLQTALANYDAITLNSGPGNQAVVAVSQNFLNTATGWDVLHEALHAYTGWSDAQIEGTFHITPANDYGDSSAISKWLQNGCP
jgi:RHS repeat-associated protein